MNIEMNDNAGLVIGVCAIVAAIVVGVALTLAHDCFMVHQYTSRGYTRATLPGECRAQWVKAEGGAHGEASVQ